MTGIALTHTLGTSPDSGAMARYAMALCLATALVRAATPRTGATAAAVCAALTLSGAFAGMSYASWCIGTRLADQLDASLEDKVTRLTFQVTSLSTERDGARRFEAQVSDSRVRGVPRRVLVSWVPEQRWNRATNQSTLARTSPLPEVLPGQIWRAALVLRRPHGTANPALFDYEGYMFARGVRAIGKVRGNPVLLGDDPRASLEVFVARVRHVVRAGMRDALGDSRYGAVMIALAIGDQDSVLAEDWRIFGLTGITHLVSISGSHVTMLAAMAAWAAMLIWKRARFARFPVCEVLPARLVGAIIAVIVAWGYCLLAGWGVPARRTFLMLAVASVGLGARAPLTPTRIVCVSAALVVTVDPWAPMATGFWLSFGAVIVLFGAGAGAASASPALTMAARLRTALAEAARLQWLITLAMLPVIAFLFQQASASSPFANAIAIPAITFIVTPLALATGLLGMIPGLHLLASVAGWIGHQALYWTLIPVRWLAEVPWATLDVAQTPWQLLLIALTGVCWSLQPPGLPARWAGWCLVMPALAWQPPRPHLGEWNLVALDVGQGSALIVITRSSNLLFDTGPAIGGSDAGERIVVPALRALGVRSLDTLVVSHPDLDHAGGMRSVLAAVPVARAFTSFDLPRVLAKRGRDPGTIGQRSLPGENLRCERGLRWSVDGVDFEFLHPQPLAAGAEVSASSSNARSCVLLVKGQHHRAILTGDIGKKSEQALVAEGLSPTDVVVVAHHGSRTSSSQEFVHAVQASHALVQAGRHNRFRHPDTGVLARWRQSGARIWRSDLDGAVTARSVASGLVVNGQRQVHRRYWHGH